MKSVRKVRGFGNERGIAAILVAGIMVTFILLFVVVGIEFTRMYYVRGELQNAADSAALAGVKLITGDSTNPGMALKDNNSTNYGQIDAREAAWKFACRNRAAGASVFLAGEGSGSDCNTPPADLNQASNDPNGDIVIGYWSETPKLCASTGVVDNFCPANGSTGNPINALKTRPQRASGLEAARGSVDFLFAGIGNMVGWTKMDIRRQAVASDPPKADAFITMCVSACTDALTFPRVLTPGECSAGKCVDSAGNEFACSACYDSAGNPVNCSDCGGNTISCTTCYDGSGNSVGCPCSDHVAWTTLLTDPTNTPGVSAIICGNQPTQEVCGQMINTTLGTVTTDWGDFKSRMFSPTYDSENKVCENAGGAVVPCNSSAYSVKYWTILVPVTETCPPGWPGQWDPKLVSEYAKVTLEAVCSPGGAGGCSGTSVHDNKAAHSVCPGGIKAVVVDKIECVSCADKDSIEGVKTGLVK